MRTVAVCAIHRHRGGPGPGWERLAQSILEEQFDSGHVAGLGLLHQLVGNFLEVFLSGAVQESLSQRRDLPGKRVARSSLVAFGKASIWLAFVRRFLRGLVLGAHRRRRHGCLSSVVPHHPLRA